MPSLATSVLVYLEKYIWKKESFDHEQRGEAD